MKQFSPEKPPVYSPFPEEDPGEFEGLCKVAFGVLVDEGPGEDGLDLEHYTCLAEGTVPAERVQENNANPGECEEGVHFYRDGEGVEEGAESPPAVLVGEDGEEEEELVEGVVEEAEDVDGMKALGEDKEGEDVWWGLFSYHTIPSATQGEF